MLYVNFLVINTFVMNLGHTYEQVIEKQKYYVCVQPKKLYNKLFLLYSSAVFGRTDKSHLYLFLLLLLSARVNFGAISDSLTCYVIDFHAVYFEK